MSKAKTLQFLFNKVCKSRVPDIYTFSVDSFLCDQNGLISSIADYFQGRMVVVRSSASDEDGANNACAGEYDSVLSVCTKDDESIRKAIKTVIASYENKGLRTGADEILVQEMVFNSVMSGVVFTHDLNTGAPYYVINYDDESGLTNTVTSGDGEFSNRTLYIHRGATQSLRSERFCRLLDAIQELELIMGSQFLDVEFALGEDMTPYLFQVRAITTQPNWNRAVANRIDAGLRGIQKFVKSRFKPTPGVYGNTTVLGQMPDWNPAEMIGRAPRALAFSLYKTLITDHAWRVAREQMGYSVPVGQPLMVSLSGQPFIDTRLSFHSYLPAKLPKEIGEKLVDEWVSRLKSRPELHDKVEFEVAITTFSFDIDEKIAALIGSALTPEECRIFKECLRQQTYSLIAGNSQGCIAQALANVEELVNRQRKAPSPTEACHLNGLYSMIDDCIRLGTIPFSILARHGFIARTILLSLHRRGILTKEETQLIQSGFRTVASDLVDDMRTMQLGELSRSEFMTKYGHLRPGTYDILSRRYDQMPTFGSDDTVVRPQHALNEFELSAKQRQEIDALLRAEGFADIDAKKPRTLQQAR